MTDATDMGRNDGGQAFPTHRPWVDGNGNHHHPDGGMSLRDYYAAHCPITAGEAWTVWCDGKSVPFSTRFRRFDERGGFWEWFASIRLEYADAMLKELSK